MRQRIVTRGIQVLVDLVVLSAAYVLAFVFRFEFTLSLQQAKLLFFTLPYVVLLQYAILALVGVPALAWRYVSLKDTSRIVIGIGGAVVVLGAIRIGLATAGGHAQFARIPLGVLAMDLIMAFVGVSGVRILRRIVGERADRQRIEQVTEPKRTLLVGAGSAGAQVAREITQRPDLGMALVGFADDNPVKIGTLIHGVKVLGDTYSLPQLIRKHRVEQVIITLGIVSSEVIRRLVKDCEDAGLPAKIIPGLYEILDGRVNLSRIRDVTIEDLLGRDAVDLDIEELRQFIGGKTILVSGAGGSIGSELCRQIAPLDPKAIVLVERAENSLFAIHRELTGRFPRLEVVPRICDVCDVDRLDAVFDEHHPEIVIHAAAHKHVPMMEWNPGEAVKNNVFGTKTLADAADRHGVKAFVMISTDKAVNPTSVMGATKRAAELYVQSMSKASKTKFVAVRFGNVLGSAGSVIPTFQEQIRNGGPVTVTHPDMRRYFMTIPEASQLVLQAATMGEGGEIFVLDMGKPVKIVELARDLIRLSGFSEEEIPIEFTGVRPGEKLFEELAVHSEKMAKTRHAKIFIGKIAAPTREVVLGCLEVLAGVSNGQTSRMEVREALRALVPEMTDPSRETGKPTDAPSEPVSRARLLH
ncbi:MAG: nucleoside-diphosphate sugar epimerase/dehydratase [Polyangiaceae bacterium]